MSGITTRTAFGKLQKASASDKDLRNESFVTGQPIGSNRRALDVMPMGVYLVGNDIAETGSNDYLIKATAHGAKVGDIFRILTSANSVNEFEVTIDKIVDADYFELGSILSAAIANGDTFAILRPIANQLSSSGVTLATITASPIQYNLNGVATNVSKDTVTPGNSRPLPVELMGAAGPITLTANQIDIDLDDVDDSVAIGDGAGNLAGMTANKLWTMDAALLTELQLKADLSETQPVSMAAVPVGAATAAKQDTLLAELQLKADLTETQPVSIASLPLPSGAATEAKQDTGNTSLATIAGKDFATQTTLAAMSAKLPAALGQLASAASLAVVLSTSQEALVNEIELNTDAVKITSGGIADAAVSNPASSGSIIALLKGLLTLITSTNTKLDTIETGISPLLDSHQTQTVTSGAAVTFTAPAGATRMIIQNSLAGGGAVRFSKSLSTPTASDGFYLGVGQSTSEMFAASLKVIATTASEDGDITVLWGV